MSESKEQAPNLQERMAQIKAKQEVKTPDATKEVVAKVHEQTTQPKQPAKLYHVFYNTLESCRMITKGGRTISFVLGKYVTDVLEEIEYLQEEMALGNPRISIVVGKEQMTADDLDPMKALKKQHIKEYLAEQEALEVAKRTGKLPESTSESTKIIPGSTNDTAGLSEQ